MKKPYLVFLLGWSVAGSAGTVVYTDRQHPPINLMPNSHVVWLDAAVQHQEKLFAQLSVDPQQATKQALAIFQSFQWSQQEQQLIKAYQAVVQAWQLGVQKYPAVVFDDRDVVYGIADVAKACALRKQHQP
ncbi:TIGR03757 family integrating conjugative element protein [Xenorhabdus bovienii]|uniref:TIGR03757 family integrating conjugative element protein n=3 Tax=Xenorhabdus bovienii TaxID=40576 RepID=A0AAJ1MX12_XENBV|nr:TIGR03757 family integrating conjugative element protein [Xenorhabdus bovienii]MDE1476829.1 TIGR03757 family integrating conjugative element protein [Xenorhabdus bovienii]MDE1486268.1 TIGR03757 family integrating conjugative element protein [Xenorhabdus bovienii]MDE1496135.1 TIGR03757 family integrating conjugative element protein [Xenorhabdus bovienii]MDE9472831.1 TIGR03757 family integrating conjugative element protein [Xenorhabdus bovienii]MDE9477007.1 TIGR03757 family integrating conjug